MKVIAFVAGRPKPQPRTTQNVKFLFSHTVEYWEQVDANNAIKAARGELNKKVKPYKETNFAYKLRRLQVINAFRDNIKSVVDKACNGNVPSTHLFYFYLFKMPNNWSKKKKAAYEWTLHKVRPDASNISRGIDDCLYEDDACVNATAHYKLYIPKGYTEGVLIMQDEEIHNFVIETAVEVLKKLHNKQPV